MNAADVLAEWQGERRANYSVELLLAHGEQGQGVTIEADGDLHPKDPPMTTRRHDGTLWALSYIEDDDAYSLVPLSAEAGDTDTLPELDIDPYVGVYIPEAEAGDTGPFPGANRPTGVGGQGTIDDGDTGGD